MKQTAAQATFDAIDEGWRNGDEIWERIMRRGGRNSVEVYLSGFFKKGLIERERRTEFGKPVWYYRRPPSPVAAIAEAVGPTGAASTDAPQGLPAQQSGPKQTPL